MADYIEKSDLVKSVLSEHIAVLLNAGNTIIIDFPANTPK
ncbi:hypothetical protein PROPEN_01838 [Proteus penneri ATCC 35198]|nr:hypothetical protein PROPEN_01838 [Proteus penneri ATCC 35198]